MDIQHWKSLFIGNQKIIGFASGIKIHIWQLKDRWAHQVKKYFFSGAFCSDIDDTNTERVQRMWPHCLH